MAILTVYSEPEVCLRKKAEPVAAVDDTVRKILSDMLDTMYSQNGVGLAANQVGILQRLVVIDVEWGDKDAIPKPLKMVNPEIIWRSDETVISKEGCLSVPDYFADVVRSAEVKAKYLDENGNPKEVHATGLFSECIQHEIDHLNGVLFIDRLSSLKRNIILRKLSKQKKMQGELL